MQIIESTLSYYKSKRVFQGLDGLRFFSILAVVWHHSVEDVNFLQVLNMGYLGVDLFFVISGFLIVTLLLREREKTKSISLKMFYMRRSLRIFPLYYGFIIAMAFYYLFVNSHSEFGNEFIKDLPIYLFYLTNFIPVGMTIMWSLASEEQFYLIWPFFEKYFKNKILKILIVLIIINQVINFYGEEIFYSIGLSHLSELSIIQTTFTPILLGVLLAHVLHKKLLPDLFYILIIHKYQALVWLSCIIALCSFTTGDIAGLTRLSIQILMMLLVASVVINDNTILSRILTFKPIERIGKISYGVYIFHIYAIVVAERILDGLGYDNNLLLFILSFIIVVVASEFSYRYYEMPFLKLKEKFSIINTKHI